MDKIKYASGSLIKVYENFAGFYLIFYLTAVAGVQAGVAGVIQSTISIFSAIICPLIGRYIGNRGIKRKTIKFMFVPASFVPCLLFSNPGLEGYFAVAFYVILGCIMILCYDSTMLAFESLGAELITDSRERASLRGFNAAFTYIGVIFGCTIAYSSIGFLQEKNFSMEWSWTISIILFVTLIMLIAGIMMLWSTKDITSENVVIEKTNLLKGFVAYLKEKNFVAVLCFSAFYGIANSLSGSLILYFATYNLGASETEVGFLYTVSAMAILVSVPIVNKLNKITGMKITMAIGVVVFTVVCVCVKLTGADTYIHACVMCVGFSFMNAAQLAVTYAMIYNIGEVHEFKTGRQEVAGYIGVFNFALGLVGAMGSFILGMVLQISGFVSGSDVQNTQVQMAIEILFIIAPPVCAIIGLLFLSKYKINNKNHAAVLEALKLKKAGKEYSTAGFEELL